MYIIYIDVTSKKKCQPEVGLSRNCMQKILTPGVSFATKIHLKHDPHDENLFRVDSTDSTPLFLPWKFGEGFL